MTIRARPTPAPPSPHWEIMMDLEQFERAARTIGAEHRKAIQDSDDTARELAKADAAYHKHLAVAIATLRPEGATVAESLAKGSDIVVEFREARDVAAARDRTALERVRLARDDRVTLLSIAAWSRA